MLPYVTRYALRARHVLPIERPPLTDGVVVVDGGRIRSVQTTVPKGCPLYDLENVVVLPGLVNAHAHLNFSQLTTPLGQPGMQFADWLELVVRRQRSQPPAESEAAQRKAIGLGLRECRRCGTTTVGDIARRGADILVCQSFKGVDRIALLELIGLTAERADAAAQQMYDWLATSVPSTTNRPFGLSPHAPYTARRELVAAACDASRHYRVLVAMHLAESLEELELLDRQSGPLVDVLLRLGAWDPSAFDAGMRPRHYLELLAQAERALVIHGNYLDAADCHWLGDHADRMAIVYCPRTHAYFGHPRYPLVELLAAGATVALGTDGRGSNPDLSLLAEMRHVARAFPEIAPSEIVRIGTLGGAQALGCADRVGSLLPGKDADFAVIKLPESAAGDPCAALLHADSEFWMTIHRGRVCHPRLISIEEQAGDHHPGA